MTDVEAGGATRYAGARIHRVEDARLLTGRGTYVDDVALPGMLHACFVRSPFARAAIRGIDTSAALALPGVRAVFTAADLNPGVHEQWHTLDRAARAPRRRARRWPRTRSASSATRSRSSSPTSRYLAEDAAELVEVDYEPLPAGRRLRRGRGRRRARPRGPRLERRSADSPGARRRRSTRSSPRPPTSSSETIHQQAYAAVPMEARGPGRRLTPAHRRAHDLRGDPVAARGAAVLLPAARASPSTASAS